MYLWFVYQPFQNISAVRVSLTFFCNFPFINQRFGDKMSKSENILQVRFMSSRIFATENFVLE